MGWRTTGDVAEFLAFAGNYLRAERARNTVILTVTGTMRANRDRYHGGPHAGQDGRPLFGWWAAGSDGGIEDDGIEPDAARAAAQGRGADLVGAAFLHTPPFPVVLSAMPAPVATELAARTLAGRSLTGVNAGREAATAFGDARRESTGCLVGVRRRMRLYRLGELARPDPPADGAPRPAEEADAALIEHWFTAFRREVDDADSTDAAAAVREWLSYGGITVWEAAGQPVSIAGVTRQVAGMVRVGPVYTPPEWRGRGYATAVTAAVSALAVEAGTDEVLLYTDLANPVSNSIYQRIGYRPVEDRVLLTFSAG